MTGNSDSGAGGDRIGSIGDRVGSRSTANTSAAGVHGRDSSLFDRLLRLSNGVFAISLTLLVLSVAVPADTPSSDLFGALVSLTPSVVAFAVTVFVVALYWKNHHFLFETFRGVDATLIGLNFVYLALVAIVPFPNELISAYQGNPWAYVVFATVLTLLSAVDLAMFAYAKHRRLLRDAVTRSTYRVELGRAVVTTLVFAASVPLSFLLVGWTPLLWLALVPLDRAVARGVTRLETEYS